MSGRIIFITGGARSGKSRFAEGTARRIGGRAVYIATAAITDDEMRDRIERHRKGRPADWETREAWRGLDGILMESAGAGCVLLDCVTNMVGNIMMETDHVWENISIEKAERVEADILAEIGRFITAARSFEGTVIAVSNELGMGLVPPYPLGRYFRDFAGRANQHIAEAADEVYFMVAGIPLRIK